MKHVLRLTYFLLTLALLLPGVLRAQETDQALAQRLLGQWQEFRKLNCEGHQQVMSLNAGGSFEVKGVIYACDRNRPFTWRGKWQVSGGRFKYVTTFSDPADLYQVGETFDDEILSVTAKEWVMREQSTGNKSIAYRIR